MTISEFAPLIQLGASIAIAVVAVDSVKSYTKQIADRLYQFPDFIKSEFKECYGKLPDQETLDHLDPVDLNGKSTNSSIERVKRNRENVKKRIDEAQENTLKRVNEICQAKSLSSLNLTLFIYNAVLLFLGGLESSNYTNVHLFTVLYSLCVFLFILTGWIVGECECKKKIFHFSSLLHSILCSVTIGAISVVLFFLLKEKYYGLNQWIESYWHCFFIVGLLLTYINFLIYAAKVGHSASDFKSEVSTTKEGILPDCESVSKEVEDLLATTRVSNTLNAD